MKRDDLPGAGWTVPPESIELALDALERSRAFRASPRHRRLLRYLIGRTLEGHASSLKETVIAIEVFGRPPDRFDPRRDTIVRVEARRLRARLAAYDAGEGQGAAVRIELPVGSYVPSIALRMSQRGHAAATRRARDLVERGEHFLRLATSKANLEQAIERFDVAQRESPTYAPAYVGLARAWFNLASGWYCDPRPAGEHAIESLERALELEPAHAVAWALLGAFQYQFERDWPAARRSFRRALALAPDSAFVHTAYGWQLTARGLLEQAETELTRARELDPQYVNSRVHMVNLRAAQGRLADAEHEIDAMRDIAPDSMVAVGMSAALALFRREPERAVALYERCLEMAPDHPSVPLLLACAHAMAGRRERARRLEREVHERFADRFVSPYVLAIVAVRRGDCEQALSLLEQALDDGDPQAVLLVTDPSFDDVRGHARWPRLLQRLGVKPAG